MARVTVRYYGGAAAAAGSSEEVCAADTVAALLADLADRHNARLDRVLAVASLLVDGQIAREPGLPLADGQTIDVLPPFAGG